MKWTFFSEMPSTNVRIAVTLLLAIATGARVVLLGWNPSWEWLAFLIIWAGLDVAQFGVKRATQSPPPPTSPPEVGA